MDPLATLADETVQTASAKEGLCSIEPWIIGNLTLGRNSQ